MNNIDSFHFPRKVRPDVFIVYKPLLYGERGYQLGSFPDRVVLKDGNTLLHKILIVQLFEHVNKVHFLTSQTGLKAFIRESKEYSIW